MVDEVFEVDLVDNFYVTRVPAFTAHGPVRLIRDEGIEWCRHTEDAAVLSPRLAALRSARAMAAD